jgi:hypothetical protein
MNLQLLTLTVYYLGDQIKGVRWVGHVTCMEEKRKAYRVLVWKLEVRDHLEDLGIDERIILKCILR